MNEHDPNLRKRKAFRLPRAAVCLLGALLLGASLHAQPTVTLSMQSTDLKSVIWEIERQSGIRFIYNAQDIGQVKIPAVSMAGKTVPQALDEVMRGTGFGYDLRDGIYVIRRGEPTPPPASPTHLTVSGIVTGAGSVLPGATVTVRGTTTGTVTDRDGRYTLSVPRSDTTTLVVNYIGMKTASVLVLNRTTLDVVLDEEAEQIETIVATGYRSIAADSYTGSAKVISSALIGTRAIGSVEEALRGLSPGTLVAASGQPGEQNEVRLRGVGSMNADNQPLYVVDGVVWDQINMSGNSNTPTNPLNALNPSDIANITELKDAASAALYGSRGANGVIVITTKSGLENEKTSFTLGLQTGFSMLNTYPELVDGRQFAELWTEGEMHDLIRRELADSEGKTSRTDLVKELQSLYADKDGYTYGRQNYNYNQWMKVAQGNFNALYAMPAGDGTYRRYDFFAADADKLPSTDWFEEISRLAPFIKANLSMQGGSRTMRYYASMEYFDQQGTIIGSQLKRYSARIKLSSESDKQLVNWGTNMYISSTLQSGPLAGGQNYNSPQYAAVMLPSVIAPKLEDGSYNFFFPNNILNTNHNPVASANENINEKPLTSITAQGWLQFNLLPWLKFRSTNTIYYTLVRRHAYYSREFGTGISTSGQLYERDSHNRKITSTNLFTVSKTWRGRHRLNLIAGGEIENQRNTYNEIQVSNFATDRKPSASMGSQMSNWNGGGYGYSLASLLSSADYSYRYRYFISGSYRMDASSRFGPGYRTGHFWSVSGAYKIASEPWFKPLLKTINYLRFRGSYGVNGTLPSQYYYWRNAFEGSAYMSVPGASQRYRPRPELTWEGNRIWNVGMDARFLDDRISLTVEYYDRKSKDLLQDVRVSMTSGYQTMLMNTSAGINNHGLEAELTGVPLRTPKQRLELSVNLATLKSTYYGLQTQELDNYSRQLMANGESVYSWYLRQWAGVDPSTGSVLYPYYDEQGNRQTTTSTANIPFGIVGQGLPKVSGGVSLNYTYGSWSLSALCSFAWGHQIYDRLGGSVISTDGGTQFSASVDQLDRWTPDNPYASSPLRVNNSATASRYTRFLKNGAYLKVRNIKLQYEVPQSVLKAVKIASAAVFVQTENPFIFSHIPGYDPEMSMSGYRYTDRYPTPTIFTAGLTLNF